MLEGSPAIQRDLDRLEEWANRNPVKLNKRKYKILQLGRKSPWQQYRLGIDWLRSSSAEKTLGSLVNSKMNISQQCALTANKVNDTLGYMNRTQTAD